MPPAIVTSTESTLLHVADVRVTGAAGQVTDFGETYVAGIKTVSPKTEEDEGEEDDELPPGATVVVVVVVVNIIFVADCCKFN